MDTPITPMDPRVEMFQRGEPKEAFFNMKALAPRPLSTATEMFDTDFEDDDESQDEADSPRHSLNSSGRRSETTLSSFEEIHTPGVHESNAFTFDFGPKKPVEGPRGPHLFRSSIESVEEYTLGMSPLTPRPADIPSTHDIPAVPQIPPRHRLTLRTDVAEELNVEDVAHWTPRQVAQWMYRAGLEQSIAEKFEENDISGAILFTLKFEDLRELDIPSFGLRTKVWNEIHMLRGSAPSTPKPVTPIEECASPITEIRRSPPSFEQRMSGRDKSRDCDSGDEATAKRKASKRRHQKQRAPITPLESVSIVGIEQLMPKPHSCSKGENCSRWKRQQRLIDAFVNDHPISPEKGGTVWVAGDPGNPATAPAVAAIPRPFSDAVPSVVASSDVLGPGTTPSIRHLEEEHLRNVESRDPQDNVKQFLQFQHVDPSRLAWSSEVPPTPPFEMFPPIPTPHDNLRSLPRLAIPPPRPPRPSSADSFSPYMMERVEALSPSLRNVTQSPSTFYRFGTPFSEMDVPVTAVQLGPVSRDASQSVPPNMSYRSAPIPHTRSASRASRRPSFAPQLPQLTETETPSQQQQQHQQYPPPPSPPLRTQTEPTRPSAPPARPALGDLQPPWVVSPPRAQTTDDITHAGWMKKRKTKMLRHEWHEHHFTLQGTRLAMHKDARALETLEHIDVDDYAIACSSLASGSKLNAAFKAMNISLGGAGKRDEAAFAFQLIPAAIDKGVRLRKRESAMAGSGGAGAAAGADSTAAKNKTHYFAVRSRDERIDWMRELMLAKALRQKAEGYEVNVNGNMI